MLARLAALPITTWNYKAEDPAIRHMGPTAQDFYAAFGLGQDDGHIAALDSSGVALAAIQGLHQLSQEQAARIEELESENAALQQGLDDLEARVAALETVTGASYSPQSEPLGGWLPFDRLRTFLLGGLMVAAGVVVKRRHSGGER